MRLLPAPPTRVARWTTKVLLVAMLLGLFLLALRTWGTERIVYMPERYAPSPRDSSDWGPGAMHVAIPSTGENLSGWVITPKIKGSSRYCGTVLLLHGNAGDARQLIPIARWLAGFGLRVLAVDYRGYGGSTGVPSEHGLYADARAAYNYLTVVMGESGDHIVVVGHSLGASLALDLAATEDVGGVALYAPFKAFGPAIRERSGFLASLLGTDRFAFDSRGSLPRVREPAVVVVGAQDAFVRIEDATAVLELLGSIDKNIVVVPGVGHNTLWQGDAAWDALERLLDRTLVRTCRGTS